MFVIKKCRAFSRNFVRNVFLCSNTFLSRVSTLMRDIDIAILSVRPYVLPLRSGILWKWLNILSWFLYHTVAQFF